MNARWPVTQPADSVLLKSSDYLMESCHEFRIRYKQFMQPPKSGKGQSVNVSVWCVLSVVSVASVLVL